MTRPEKLTQLLDDFKLIQNKNERMDMLIYYAEDFEEVPDNIATRPFGDDNRVPACESDAFVWSSFDGKAVNYYFAVENPQGISAKAMAAILSETISGEPPKKILEIDEEIIYQLFGKSLSMGKSAGLTSMIKVVKSHALKYLNE